MVVFKPAPALSKSMPADMSEKAALMLKLLFLKTIAGLKALVTPKKVAGAIVFLTVGKFLNDRRLERLANDKKIARELAAKQRAEFLAQGPQIEREEQSRNVSEAIANGMLGASKELSNEFSKQKAAEQQAEREEQSRNVTEAIAGGIFKPLQFSKQEAAEQQAERQEQSRNVTAAIAAPQLGQQPPNKPRNRKG